MANPDNILQLVSQPGVQKDGTSFDSDHCIDSQWCRWYRGKPQKIGGYNKMISWDNHIPRGVFVVPNSPVFNIYVGDSHTLKYFTADSETGLAINNTFVDRTPALFAANDYNQWNFEVMYDSLGFKSGVILANATQNLFGVDQTVESPIYYGDMFSQDPLIETGLSTSGGMVVLHPYLLVFGNDGNVIITLANDPTKTQSDVPDRVTGSKIIAGLPVRGGNSSPAGLLWSLDSLLRVTNVGTPTGPEFAFDTITSESSLLSSDAVVEYDGIYYWAGSNRFYLYNGVVQELPNSMVLEYFFDKLNHAQRQKVWATKVTKYGEIWFHFPSGNSLECNEAVIYNTRLKCWYQTDIGRSCGDYNPIFSKPVWGDNTQDISGNYIIWRHESGLDMVVDNTSSAIDSYFETSVMSWAAVGPGGQISSIDKSFYLYRLEPDFVQSGDMTLTVNGRSYANSGIQSSAPYVFNNDPNSPKYAEKIDLREQRRLMTLKFESNVVGGNYKMGRCLLVPRLGDGRP